jgi:hypothetical protein
MTTPAEQAQDAARRARRRARLTGLGESAAGVGVDVEDTPDEAHFRDLHNEAYAGELDQATEQAAARESVAPASEMPSTAPEPEPEEGDGEGGDYDEFTVDELRDDLRSRDLHTSGTKAELIARLEDDDEETN